MNPSTTQSWKSYGQGCLQLLYWIYFKPFTLTDHLKQIHPDLKIDDFPVKLQAQSATNPRLRYLISQIVTLSLIVPLLITMTVGLIMTILSQPFNWGGGRRHWPMEAVYGSPHVSKMKY